MTTTPEAVADAAFHDLMMRADTEYMSRHMFGLEYAALQEIIYPAPSYKSFIINKRNGSPRLIQEPRKPVKDLQYAILDFLERNANPPKPCVHGFTANRSIVTNALKHCDSETRFLLNIDIENFFPSISFYRVRGLLQKPPFSCAYPVATVLAHICTKSGELPQGAPTSPFIANLICRRLDSDLMELARRHQSTYTRYADDITFSFSIRNVLRLPVNICSLDAGVVYLGNELVAIITRHGFKVNDSKSRISSRWRRLEVTGLTINEFPNVKREFVDNLRGALHAWEKYGLDLAQAEWKKHVEANEDASYKQKRWRRQRRCKGVPDLSNVLWGKLLYLRMVRGSDDTIYSRLAARYNALSSRDLGTGSILPVKLIVKSHEDAERATYVVEWEGDYELDNGSDEPCVAAGTAFSYGSAGRLITCEHVFRVESQDGQVHFSSPRMKNKKISVHNPVLNTKHNARLVRFDLDRDLAVLEIDGDAPALPHFVGRDTLMRRNDPGLLIGYPNWHPGKPINQTPTSVSNHYTRGGLRRLEVSELIRQGNSGGPFVDELFRVAGVAQMGATQTQGNNECLTVDELERWLASQA